MSLIEGWVDMDRIHYPPPDGVTVQGLPPDQSEVVQCYWYDDTFWTLFHEPIPIRWWRYRKDYEQRGDVTTRQFSIAKGYIQSIIERDDSFP